MGDALSTFIKQLTTNLKQAPGWVPLAAVCYVVYDVLFRTPPGPQTPRADHKELIVATAALVLYVIGDALDKALWKRFKRAFLQTNYETVETTLAIQEDEGLYRVSKALAVAAGHYDGSWIQVKNELAKLCRSLVLPCLVVCPLLLLRGQIGWSTLALLGVPVLLWTYLKLKASHIDDLCFLSTRVYSNDPENYFALDVTQQIRLFFWEGKLVSSGRRRLRDGLPPA